MTNKNDTVSLATEASLIRINGPVEVKNHGWDELMNKLMFISTLDLKKEESKELRGLATSQSEISFLSSLRSVLMNGANPNDGTFEVNDQLKTLLKKVANPESQSLMAMLDDLGLKFRAQYSAESFNHLFSDIEALPSSERQPILDQLETIGIYQNQNPSPTKEQLEELVKLASIGENIELRRILTKNDILNTQDKFTKPERESLIESIHVTITQKQGIHNMNSQMVLHKQTLINQMQERVPDLHKTKKRVVDKMLDGMKSGR